MNIFEGEYLNGEYFSRSELLGTDSDNECRGDDRIYWECDNCGEAIELDLNCIDEEESLCTKT